MSWISAVGLIAAFCTTSAFAPQVIQSWRSRQTKDISLAMYVLMTTGIFLWLIYGLLKRDGPLICANAVTLVLASSILYLKLTEKRSL